MLRISRQGPQTIKPQAWGNFFSIWPCVNVLVYAHEVGLTTISQKCLKQNYCAVIESEYPFLSWTLDIIFV